MLLSYDITGQTGHPDATYGERVGAAVVEKID
jgi:hypothetical protein